MSSSLHSRAGALAGWLFAATAMAADPETTVPATTAAPTPAAITANAARRSERITQRIDALLKHRLTPESPLVNPSNPFAVVTGGATAPGGYGLVPEDHPAGGLDRIAGGPAIESSDASPLTNAEALTRYVGGLKIGGIIRLKDQVVQIVINGLPRKEGDFIVVERDNAVIHLQLVRIMSGAIVVRLNDAEQTFKF